MFQGEYVLMRVTVDLRAVRDKWQNTTQMRWLVRKFGKPTLFVTFTCNPKWE